MIFLRLSIFLFIAAVSSAAPQSQATEAPTPVVVATRAVPPFAMHGEDGVWHGLAIDLWEEVARQLNLTTTYVDVELNEMLDGVASSRFDAAAAALTVTAEREQRMDFSHPFLSSGLGIAVKADNSSGFWTVVKQVISPAFLQVVAALTGLLLVCGVLVWLFERRANPDQFGPGLRGIGAGFWWSAVTMTTVGYGDKSPQTLGGRVVGLLWMFTSIIVISSFTAAIASSLTVTRLESSIQGPDDLAGTRVGTVQSSTSEVWTQRRFLHPRPFASASEALNALAAGKLDAVVYDASVVRYLVQSEHAGSLSVLPARIERQDYAFALPTGSALRENINQVILEVTASEAWESSLNRYFGE